MCIVCQVVSAEPLSKKQASSVEAAVLALIGKDKKVSEASGMCAANSLWWSFLYLSILDLTCVNNASTFSYQVELSFSEDPAILGGLQVLIGDTVMDLSVATRVTELSMVLDGQDS